MAGEYHNIRDVLQSAVGQCVVDITQDDWDDVEATSEIPDERVLGVYIHLSSGNTIRFEITKDRGFWYDGVPTSL